VGLLTRESWSTNLVKIDQLQKECGDAKQWQTASGTSTIGRCPVCIEKHQINSCWNFWVPQFWMDPFAEARGEVRWSVASLWFFKRTTMMPQGFGRWSMFKVYFNGNIFGHILGYIPLHSPYVGLIYGRYLQFLSVPGRVTFGNQTWQWERRRPPATGETPRSMLPRCAGIIP